MSRTDAEGGGRSLFQDSDDLQLRIVEVGPRDGLQNESTALDLETKVGFIELLDAAGLRSIETASFVHPKWVPQMADAERVVAGTGHLDTGMHSVLVPNVAGLERALASGVRGIAVFGAASETFSRRNLNRSVDESVDMFRPVVARARAEGIRVRAYVSTIFACPFSGDVPYDAVRSLVLRMYELGADEVCLGDTTGVGTPGETYDLVTRLAAEVDVHTLAVHLHDTYGQGLANSLAAIQGGVSVVDTAAGGLGGCPFAGPDASGNLATEDLVYALARSGIRTGVDMLALLEATRHISAALGRLPRSRVARALLAEQDADGALAAGRRFFVQANSP